ncbi:CBS domain-containing protein [Streptomyces sp. NPDC001728]|uniref:CBS domain-containing protein n=1 Tax=Streptomyces sp. NPDC001728 TaxID=3154396 RepID=UPI00331BB906
MRDRDSLDPAELRVGDDMTVEVALAVMAGARTGHLLVCDDDGLATGLVTLARLTAVRESSAYTDRLRLRDLCGDGEPLTSSTVLTAGRAIRLRRLGTPSVMGGQDGPSDVPTPALALA